MEIFRATVYFSYHATNTSLKRTFVQTKLHMRILNSYRNLLSACLCLSLIVLTFCLQKLRVKNLR